MTRPGVHTEIRRWIWFLLGLGVAAHQTLVADMTDPWLLVFSLALMSHPGVAALAALLTPQGPPPGGGPTREPPADDRTDG